MRNKINRYSQEKINILKRNDKYIPDLFIEINESKEILRYFVYGSKWKKRIIKQLNQMYNNYYGIMLSKYTKNISFRCFYDLDIENIEKFINKHMDFWSNLRNESMQYYENNIDDLKYIFGNMSSFYKERLEILDKYTKASCNSFLLLISSAGNGKTNLACNISELIIKAKQPCLFFNSKDINTEMDKIFYNALSIPIFLKNYREIILSIFNFSLYLRKKYFFIIVDAINENDMDVFKNSLAPFTNNILKYSRIKILMTCRSEYFELRYDNLFKNSLFTSNSPLIIKMNTIRHNDRLFNILNEVYSTHFSFKGKITNLFVYQQLSKSLILLRLFYEVNRDSRKDVSSLSNYELYNQYLNLITINNPDFDVWNYINDIAEIMIESFDFSCVSANKIIDFSTNDKPIEFLRKIADDNFLISRRIMVDENMITRREEEKFMFTFDELRDFCIARSVLLSCNKTNPANFDILFSFLDHLNTKAKAAPYEGVLKHSYIYLKTKGDNEAAITRYIEYYFLIDNEHHARFNPRIHYDDTFAIIDIGINIILDSDLPLLDIEKKYIFNKLITGYEQDIYVFYKILLESHYHNAVYSFDIFNDFLLSLDDYNTIYCILSILSRYIKNPNFHFIKYFKLLLEKEIEKPYLKFLLLYSIVLLDSNDLNKEIIKLYPPMEGYKIFNDQYNQLICECKCNIIVEYIKLAKQQNLEGHVYHEI